MIFVTCLHAQPALSIQSPISNEQNLRIDAFACTRSLRPHSCSHILFRNQQKLKKIQSSYLHNNLLNSNDATGRIRSLSLPCLASGVSEKCNQVPQFSKYPMSVSLELAFATDGFHDSSSTQTTYRGTPLIQFSLDVFNSVLSPQ